MTAVAHWADDPTDDLAWLNYRLGYELGHEHRRAAVRVDVADLSEPFRDGYTDGHEEITP